MDGYIHFVTVVIRNGKGDNMPFIAQDRRIIIKKEGLRGLPTIEPGDRCYVFYKDMVNKWKQSPRWATAHKIYEEVGDICLDTLEDVVAQGLAWQVFFMKYVWPYELDKERINGGIE